MSADLDRLDFVLIPQQSVMEMFIAGIENSDRADPKDGTEWIAVTVARETQAVVQINRMLYVSRKLHQCAMARDNCHHGSPCPQQSYWISRFDPIATNDHGFVSFEQLFDGRTPQGDWDGPKVLNRQEASGDSKY
ncbi:N-acetyltransferase complex ARD1 subunit [Perkinsela sp. CCAP 1560/4]|nr:N-acetyltransferase complex ARD1 subunit [Perkinsela sp. CCAP 1560/4]|eukprot:KNH06276.1 N-acetyltransferase complex ARD1 subunit [Perkinsela sp. CCAP 1560/4]